MKRQILVLVALFVLLVVAVLPADAATVDGKKVPGDATCASVGSSGTSSLRIEPVTDGAYPNTPDPNDVEITLNGVTRTALSFDIEGALVHDVIVKGSAANHYSYDTPVAGDDNLVIPNGNKLNHVEFCYVAGEVELICNAPVSDANGTTTGTFMRFNDPGTDGVNECDGPKVAFLDVSDDRVITFIPRGADDPIITYQAVLTFPVVSASNPVLKYDQTDNGVDLFETVPQCGTVIEGVPSVEERLPEGHSWCWTTRSVSGGIATWNLLGIGDPKFR